MFVDDEDGRQAARAQLLKRIEDEHVSDIYKLATYWLLAKGFLFEYRKTDQDDFLKKADSYAEKSFDSQRYSKKKWDDYKSETASWKDSCVSHYSFGSTRKPGFCCFYLLDYFFET